MTRLWHCHLTVAIAVLLAGAVAAADEFVGPFPSWADVRSEFGAVGDGKADDTAAIQKGLEAVRSKDGTKRVLYFPAGTYRITATLKLDRLSHTEPMGMSITGEDPATTSIVWDGPAGQDMFHDNAWFSSLSRLTFDGRGKAGTILEQSSVFATGNEVTDAVFTGADFGITAGTTSTAGIAETAVLRCRFIRCAKAGLSIQNFNSLDWYVWDSWFEDCGIGATNEFGAGNFHVYNSTFLRSVDADITIRHTSYLSMVGNTSIGSKRFFHAKRAANWKDNETWGSQVTLQDNLILDPQEATPIVIENNGPNLILDNTIRAQGAGPMVLNEPPSEQADLICIGNTWTAAQAIRLRGRLTELDNRTVPATAIATAKPAPVPFLRNLKRPVIEVAPGADTATVQAAIDRAATLKGQRPVVHLGKGAYAVTATLVIPAGSDLQLLGDGAMNCTELRSGGTVSPLIRILGPSHAAVSHVYVAASTASVAIEVSGCDQPGSRMFGEQLNVDLNTPGYSFRFDRLRHTQVELRNAGHGGMQVMGDGAQTASTVALFCGASGQMANRSGNPLYDVQQGGRLLVRDIWYEGDGWGLFNLTGSGEFALHASFVAPNQTGSETELRKQRAAIHVDGFRGKLAFTLCSAAVANLRVQAPSADLKLLLLGFKTNSGVDIADPRITGQVVSHHARTERTDGTGTDAADGVGKPTPEFLREMLKPLRGIKPQPATTVAPEASDVRFNRVWMYGREGLVAHGG